MVVLMPAPFGPSRAKASPRVCASPSDHPLVIRTEAAEIRKRAEKGRDRCIGSSGT
jgi:hypothetical protein